MSKSLAIVLTALICLTAGFIYTAFKVDYYETKEAKIQKMVDSYSVSPNLLIKTVKNDSILGYQLKDSIYIIYNDTLSALVLDKFKYFKMDWDKLKTDPSL